MKEKTSRSADTHMRTNSSQHKKENNRLRKGHECLMAEILIGNRQSPKLCELETATARADQAVDICSRRYPTNDDINRRRSGADISDAATYSVAAVRVSNGQRRQFD